ncbi:MAG: TetR/AcrR family transcriptional regulator [Candidatus Methanomethylophilaceae archaeon]|nr:TetR/AcrR family transcriptional regulator [Candidatus Methanomethylophilaceae archaeon]
MGTYHRARENTERKIQEAYWSLFEKGEDKKATVQDVCDLAGINRSTFYLHYRNLDEVFGAIKDRQMSLLKKLFDSTDRSNVDYNYFIPELEMLYDSNERYLLPLVIEYKDPQFAKEYRDYMCERMQEDLGFEFDHDDPVASAITKVIVKEMVDLHWESLHYHIASLEIIDRISNGIFNIGLRRALKDDFGITVGFDRMQKAP